MKRVLILCLISFLILGACSQDNEKKADEQNDNNKSESKKKEEKMNDQKKVKKNSEQQSEESENLKSEGEKSNNTVGADSTNQINFNNIMDRNSLEAVIYGNYTEEQKIIAYNSAVANGVIPQGNVMEGPASAAYQSSLRVESGQEKSVYSQENDKKDYENNGVYRTAEEQKAHEKWINDQNQWAEEQQAKEDALQKEYFDLSNKKYEDGVSKAEYDAMEKRQNEILDQVEPIN